MRYEARRGEAGRGGKGPQRAPNRWRESEAHEGRGRVSEPGCRGVPAPRRRGSDRETCLRGPERLAERSIESTAGVGKPARDGGLQAPRGAAAENRPREDESKARTGTTTDGERRHRGGGGWRCEAWRGVARSGIDG